MDKEQNKNVIVINPKISYIPCSENPLSADIGIIQNGDTTWLYDVGGDEQRIAELTGHYPVVLSHFHQDHTGNIGRLRSDALYVSGETYRHIHMGTIVQKDIYMGDLHIFPLPSSHCKGCLGLEVDETYAFVGDALYCKFKDGSCMFNAQQVNAEILVLKALKAKYLLVSHFEGFIRPKEEVIAELEALYSLRSKTSSEIRVKK